MSSDAWRDFIERIRELLASAQIELALDELKAIRHSAPRDLGDEVILQASRHHRLLRERRKGVMTQEQFEVERNRLTSALLDLLPELVAGIGQRLSPIPGGPMTAPEAAREVSGIAFEAILGINNLKQISWLGRGLQRSRSVCRVMTPDGVGTGFLVSPTVLMTNHHVVPDTNVAARTFVEFDYEEDASGNLKETVRYALDPDPFRTSPEEEFDYTLVGVKPDPVKRPLGDWGFLPLNPHADPVPSEHVVIIQHPNGGLKQIVLTANSVIGTQGRLLHYTSDTLPGSSGAPVFNDSWQVIAIHHAERTYKGTDGKPRSVNEGILMSAIKPDAGEAWPFHT
jgi:V8-like Glu-specific endopeptidase